MSAVRVNGSRRWIGIFTMVLALAVLVALTGQADAAEVKPFGIANFTMTTTEGRELGSVTKKNSTVVCTNFQMFPIGSRRQAVILGV